MVHRGGCSTAQVAMHWPVALLVVGQSPFKGELGAARAARGWGERVAFDPPIAAERAGGFANQLVALRWLGLRRRRGAPPPANEPAAVKRAAPVTQEWLCSVFLARAVSGATSGEHDALKVLLLALIALLVLVVPFHWVVQRNIVLHRMTRPGRRTAPQGAAA